MKVLNELRGSGAKRPRSKSTTHVKKFFRNPRIVGFSGGQDRASSSQGSNEHLQEPPRTELIMIQLWYARIAR